MRIQIPSNTIHSSIPITFKTHISNISVNTYPQQDQTKTNTWEKGIRTRATNDTKYVKEFNKKYNEGKSQCQAEIRASQQSEHLSDWNLRSK